MAFSDRLRVQTGFDRLSRAGLVGALLVACTLVVVLARQAAALRDRNARLTQAIVDPARGMWVPTFTAVTLDGDTVRVGESDAGGGQLLFVFTTGCSYCRSMIPTWTELAAASTRSSPPAMVVGVSLDSAPATRRYALEHGLPYRVITMTDRKLASLYRTGTVPLTLVLDSVGRVAHARIGEFHDEPAIDSVLAALGHTSAVFGGTRATEASP